MEQQSYQLPINTVPAAHYPTASWFELDAAAFAYNLSCIRTVVGPDKAIMAVVKANAYGHGLKEIGQLCERNPEVAWLCTASLSEALVLRAHGICKSILVMCFIDVAPEQAILNDIDLPVYTYEQARVLDDVARSLGALVYMHVKIDTGLSRLGVLPENALALIEQINQLSHVRIRGLWTHFSQSDDADPAYTLMQIERFDQVIAQCAGMLPESLLIHAANSAGAIRFGQARYTGVRVGAAMYGMGDARAVGVRPVVHWKTRVYEMRDLNAGVPVSYACTYITKRPTRMALLPVGYGDGYDRRLSNCGVVYIRGQQAPVIGRVCMNVVLVDVTDIPGVCSGDEVILVGALSGCSVDDIARQTGALNRDIATGFSPFIDRFVK